MTKSTITRERIQRIIRAIDSEAYDEEEIREWLSSDEIMELARIALAAMGSEPVAYRWNYGGTTIWRLLDTKPGPGSNSRCPRVIEPLYRHAQSSPVVPSAYVRDERGAMMLNGKCEPRIGFGEGWNACRAAMLQAGNSPVIGIDPASGPDRTVEVRYVAPPGYVMVPRRLTAENGAKWELSGEFSETKFVNCPECFGDDECETCDGSGRIGITVPVTWTTIKEIWAKGVEHFAAAPQEVKGE